MYVVTNVFSQNQGTEEKVWIVDDDGKMYINKDLPVYLWLSTSPDESSKKYRLKSHKTDKFTNPMYFDTEGHNTVHSPFAVDNKTKKIKMPREDVVFDLWSDGLAPVTSSKLFDAPKYIKSGTIYYGKNLKLNLKSTDAVSGIKEILLSVNAAAYTAYKSNTDLNKEGNTSIKYYATDRVGNVEGSHSKSFVVDITAPIITKTITGPQKGNIYGQKTKIVLASTDNLSGVKKQYYLIDGKRSVYSAPIPVRLVKKGNHKFNYYSVDNVENDNKDDGRAMDFTYDDVAPTVTAEVVGDQHKSNYLFVSERSKIKLAATDETGVKEITYGIDTKATNVYSDQFFLKKQQGIQNISYKAEDEVDNVSRVHGKQIFLDNKTPVTGITYKTPQFFNNGTLFINGNTNIKLYSKDIHSGVKVIEYAIDNNSSFQTYTSEIKIPDEGEHKIYFKSTDNVNNVEVIKESDCFVDVSSPEIFIKYSIEPIGKETKDGKSHDVFPKHTKVYFAATDKWCGTEKIYYSVNGSKKALYVSTQAFQQRNLIAKKGFYTVVITAVDKLGNSGEKTETFFIAGE
ncbi:MAG: hypothetical protein B6I20_03880 [Bacteroidetes bacterium 4572_117]|nr:MAG: hypothetical protein B6I20_03880 [Bacteroidetes bacterium 4572_117]